MSTMLMGTRRSLLAHKKGSSFTDFHSVAYDGVDDQVVFTNPSPLNFERTQPFSVILWIYPVHASNDNLGMFSKFDGDQGYLSYLNWAGPLWYVRFVLSHNYGNNRCVCSTSTPVVPNSAWSQLVITYDGGSNSNTSFAIYVNGSAQTVSGGDNTLTGTTLNTSNFIVGAVPSLGVYFQNYIDDMAVFNVKLSSAQVTEAYNGGVVYNLNTHSAAANMQAYWTWELTANDQSNVGNHINGTLTNGASYSTNHP